MKKIYYALISYSLFGSCLLLIFLSLQAQDSNESGTSFETDSPRYVKLDFSQNPDNSSSGIEDPTKVCDYGLIPQYPNGSLGGHASAVLGDTLYIAGGMDTTGSVTNRPASVEVTRYAINTGIWSSGRSMPGPKSGGDLVACGGALYYIGGGAGFLTNGSPTATTYKYTPAGGWETVANIPTPVVGNVAECWGDSVIFSIGGGWNSYYRGIQVYRPGSDNWSRTVDSLPTGTGRRSFAGGLEGNKIFVAAGYSGAFRKDFLIGTIGNTADTVTWTPMGDVPMRGTGNSRPGGHAVNGRFYVVAGETSPAPAAQDSIFVYDIDGSSWLPNPLTGRGSNSASNYWGAISSSVINGKVRIWIPGGFWPATVTNTKLMVLTDSIDCEITNIDPVNNTVPSDYSLAQNFPNPFNPNTSIRFEIPSVTHAKLTVYNAVGEEVDVILNETISGGIYQLSWDGSGFASGIYYYRLTAGGFTQTKKMMLIK